MAEEFIQYEMKGPTSVRGVCNYGYVPLSYLGNIITRIETTTISMKWVKMLDSLDD